MEININITEIKKQPEEQVLEKSEIELQREAPKPELIQLEIDTKKPQKPTVEKSSITMEAKPRPETRETTTLGLDVKDTRPLQELELALQVDKHAPEELVPPSFIQPIVTIIVKDGDSARFTAVIKGVPTPEITWLRDGVNLREAPEFKITIEGNFCELILEECFPEDGGKITCKASNPAGVATCSAKLIVRGWIIFEILPPA